MSREIELFKEYIKKVSADESATEQEIAYWNYELYVQNQEEHSSKLRGLVKAIHKEQLRNY